MDENPRENIFYLVQGWNLLKTSLLFQTHQIDDETKPGSKCINSLLIDNHIHFFLRI
jgi:hypothetical protein